jgi:LmbE family N-acetylglucosaminyl deacetylase
MNRPQGTLLAIFAHPDDETYRAGGTLALLAQQGVTVHVVTATRGEAGMIGEPAKFPGIRENELGCACQTLQLQPPQVLNFPDGHLAECDPEKIIQQLLKIMKEIQPQVLLSFGPDGLSGHPDHISIGSIASEAFQRFQKAGVLYHLAVSVSLVRALGMHQLHPVADSQITLSIDVSSVWNMKMKAIHCHASQIASSPILRQSEERQRMFLGVEQFVLALDRDPAQDFVPALLKEHILSI